MKSTTHLGFWIVLALVCIFAVPFLFSAEVLMGSLVREQEAIQNAFGYAVTEKIYNAATVVHGTIFGNTGIQAGLDSLQHSEADMRLARKVGSSVAEFFATQADMRVKALSVQLYSVILRIVVLLAWVILLLPFCVAVVYDGLQMRNVKFARMGHQNPTAFSIGFHLVVLLCAIPMLSVVIPTHVVTPLFMPFWVLLTALPFSFAIRHTQPIFTK